MNIDIRNLNHVELDVAKYIKSTKKQFIWDFTLDGKSHKIELFDSRISGKKKIVKDGLILLQTEEDTAFIKSFDVGRHNCTLIQHGEKYELRIDNQSFNHLMDLERNRVHFKNTAPTSTTYVAQAVAVDDKKVGFGLSMANITKPNPNNKPPSMFSFSIKPESQSTMQQKRFSFAVNDNNYREDNAPAKSNKNVKPLIDLSDTIQETNYQAPSLESKSNTQAMGLGKDDNQDIFDLNSYNKGNITENYTGNNLRNISPIPNSSTNNKSNQLMNTLENLYKNSENFTNQNNNYSQQPNFNYMYGMQQIGDGNSNDQYNESMNSPIYGQMPQGGNQYDLNNQLNASAFNNGMSHQPEVYQNIGTGKINGNFNNQSQSNFIGYPSMQNSVYTNNQTSNFHLAQSKNTNNDPLSDLFG